MNYQMLFQIFFKEKKDNSTCTQIYKNVKYTQVPILNKVYKKQNNRKRNQ